MVEVEEETNKQTILCVTNDFLCAVVIFGQGTTKYIVKKMGATKVPQKEGNRPNPSVHGWMEEESNCDDDRIESFIGLNWIGSTMH
jgi:hypothetical protein